MPPVKQDKKTLLAPKSAGKSKVRAVPNFSKLHNKWSTTLESGKACGKKPCTVVSYTGIPTHVKQNLITTYHGAYRISKKNLEKFYFIFLNQIYVFQAQEFNLSRSQTKGKRMQQKCLNDPSADKPVTSVLPK